MQIIYFLSVSLTVRELTSSSLSNIYYLSSSLCVSNAHICCNVSAFDSWFWYCHCILSDGHQTGSYHHHLWTILLLYPPLCWSLELSKVQHIPSLSMGNCSNVKEKYNSRILKLGGKVIWIFKYLDQVSISQFYHWDFYGLIFLKPSFFLVNWYVYFELVFNFHESQVRSCYALADLELTMTSRDSLVSAS